VKIHHRRLIIFVFLLSVRSKYYVVKYRTLLSCCYVLVRPLRMSRPPLSSKGSITKDGCDKLRKAINALSEPKNHGAKAIEDYIKGKSKNKSLSTRGISASSIENIWTGKSVDKKMALLLIEELGLKDFVLDQYWVYDNAPEEIGDDKKDPSNPPRKRTLHNLPRLGTVHFVGRISQLQELYSKLHSNQNKTCRVWLSGMGAVGKTELAHQYAEAQQSFYDGGICWVDAGTEAEMVTKITSFVQGTLDIPIPSHLSTSEELIKYSVTHWAAGKTLLIFDNIDRFSDIEFFIAKFNNSQFNVIVISRLKNTNDYFENIELNVLLAADSFKLLESIIGSQRIMNEEESANELCELLGHLPLGLELLGNCLRQEPSLLVENILDEIKIKQKTGSALDHQIFGMDEDLDGNFTAKSGLVAAFNTTWDKLVNRSDRTAEIALYLGRFSSDPIPWDVIAIIMKVLEIQSSDVLRISKRALVSYHLMKLDDKEHDTYRIHPLLREYFRSKPIDEISIHQLMLAAISQATRGQSQDSFHGEIDRYSVYIPHFHASTMLLIDQLTPNEIKHNFTVLANYYLSSNQVTRAVITCETAVLFLRQRSDCTPTILSKMLQLNGSFYIGLSRYVEAELLFKEALALQSMRDNSNNKDYALILVSLANVQARQKKFDAARDNIGEALPILIVTDGRTKALFKSIIYDTPIIGVASTDYAMAIKILGLSYFIKKDYHNAEVCLLSVLMTEKFIQYRNPTYPISYETFGLLGNIYSASGKHEEAEEYLKDALRSVIEIYGEENIAAASYLLNLAKNYFDTGEIEKCFFNVKKSFFLLLKDPEFAPEIVLQSFLLLLDCAVHESITLTVQDRQDVANFIDKFPDLKSISGEGLMSISLLCVELEEYKKAVKFFSKALKKELTQELPDEDDIYHIPFLLVLVAQTYFSQEDYEKAISCYQKAIRTCRASLGKDNPYLRRWYFEYGDVVEKAYRASTSSSGRIIQLP
jgi:tetratricopeptide (TPR) repeat protein